jgi:thioredoxin reductase (NADPH)
MDATLWDMLIIGGGAGGLTAGLYASRARAQVLLLEGGATGGAMMLTDAIENYPGFPNSVEGPELTQLMETQATKFGLQIESEQATGIRREADTFVVECAGGVRQARTLVLAMGSEHKRLGVPGEDRLAGRGVSYCATCDGAFFRDKEIIVVGGGDSAVKEALFLSRYGRRVQVVHRRNELRAEKIAQERAFANPKLAFVWDSVVDEVVGERKVEAVRLHNVRTGAESKVAVDGVFVFVGMHPRTDVVQGLVELDAGGFIVTDVNMRTSVPGIWSAGDIRAQSYKQLATAVGDGCTAAMDALEFLEKGGKH